MYLKIGKRSYKKRRKISQKGPIIKDGGSNKLSWTCLMTLIKDNFKLLN